MRSGIASVSVKSSRSLSGTHVWVLASGSPWPAKELGPKPTWLEEDRKDGEKIVCLAGAESRVLVVRTEKAVTGNQKESLRKLGNEAGQAALKLGWQKVQAAAIGLDAEAQLLFSEGLVLGSYRFDKYRSRPGKFLREWQWVSGSLDKKELSAATAVWEAVALARNLVNEPAGYLSTKKFAEIIEKTGKEDGFDVDILGKNKIQSLKMGGLLGVNQGSDAPPAFAIMEHRHRQAVNKKPLVLVGKGVVYDTGGHSLKTSGGMEAMKCDMAGAATVLALMSAVARLKLPLHVIGLVPLTDNRLSAAALSPGDIITISDGTTVEVLNTDAEGRLILADALVFARKYKPDLVLDFATLTGAAARAIGKEGLVFMGTAGSSVKSSLREAQDATYERGVEFPLWDEYGEQIKSPVADLKNIGGAEAGAITAGKFLQHFTDYPWIHFDIAGPAFYDGAAVGYIPKGGTGFGVRLILEFLRKRASRN